MAKTAKKAAKKKTKVKRSTHEPEVSEVSLEQKRIQAWEATKGPIPAGHTIAMITDDEAKCEKLGLEYDPESVIVGHMYLVPPRREGHRV